MKTAEPRRQLLDKLDQVAYCHKQLKVPIRLLKNLLERSTEIQPERVAT